MGYTRDVTDRKELQARLMQQDRLAAVGTLAAGLAHELNNPLTYLSFHLHRLGELTRARPHGDEAEALSLVRAGATITTTRIETDLAETSNLVAHPSRLGQVFLNVTLNALEAVEHRDDGLVRVTLRETEAWLEVAILDNGVGVPDACKPRLFDPFFTTKPKGTGLGLSISHAIVTDHGGAITIESTEGQSRLVTIRLPKRLSAV